jgi:ankyrin repeat protein
MAAWQGHKEVVELLLSAGASLYDVDEEVIEPSVNLRN